jgi:hypothetical protein
MCLEEKQIGFSILVVILSPSVLIGGEEYEDVIKKYAASNLRRLGVWRFHGQTCASLQFGQSSSSLNHLCLRRN